MGTKDLSEEEKKEVEMYRIKFFNKNKEDLISGKLTFNQLPFNIRAKLKVSDSSEFEEWLKSFISKEQKMELKKESPKENKRIENDLKNYSRIATPINDEIPFGRDDSDDEYEDDIPDDEYNWEQMQKSLRKTHKTKRKKGKNTIQIRVFEEDYERFVLRSTTSKMSIPEVVNVCMSKFVPKTKEEEKLLRKLKDVSNSGFFTDDI